MSSINNLESHKMDLSLNSTPDYDSASQVLEIPPVDIHDLVKINDFDSEVLTNKNLSIQNATNSHPLMYSPTSSISNDYPDLIPEKPKNLNYYSCDNSGFSLSNARNEHPSDTTDNNDYKDQSDIPISPSRINCFNNKDVRKEPDLGDNDNDNSIYEARLSSNLQNVSLTMNEKEGNLNFLAHNQRSNKLRLIKVLHNDISGDSDVSSAESMTESLKSEDIYIGNDDLKQDVSVESESSMDPIEPLTADEEKKHLRHWQCMVLPGGEQRTIDMRVIEPYKRVLSHGGYLRAGGNTAIVVFSACFLPDRSRVDYDYVMDNLFLYVLWTLERLVTDDYVLVYLHGGATRLPAFTWLKRCYHMVGRRLRKNLVHLYLVHPTLWIKTMLFMAKPFISSKFSRKITYVINLKELFGRIPLECNAIPDKVKTYDSFHYGL
ncbi:hypothetical protein FQA39_LY04692 [Lamprigera yunnana]|nr:hypothetical protein FQA39_LY04692 [Lamprigera yunnana]